MNKGAANSFAGATAQYESLAATTEKCSKLARSTNAARNAADDGRYVVVWTEAVLLGDEWGKKWECCLQHLFQIYQALCAFRHGVFRVLHADTLVRSMDFDRFTLLGLEFLNHGSVAIEKIPPTHTISISST